MLIILIKSFVELTNGVADNSNLFFELITPNANTALNLELNGFLKL